MATAQKKTIPDIFVDGARKGWTVGTDSILPNVLMAYVLIQILRVSGVLDVLGNIFNPIMALFGLPGKAAMVLMGAWMSMAGRRRGGRQSICVKCAQQNTRDDPAAGDIPHGSTGSVHGPLPWNCGSEVRHYPALFVISIFNAAISMFGHAIFRISKSRREAE